jgi:hypothetical protein
MLCVWPPVMQAAGATAAGAGLAVGTAMGTAAVAKELLVDKPLQAAKGIAGGSFSLFKRRLSKGSLLATFTAGCAVVQWPCGRIRRQPLQVVAPAASAGHPGSCC